MTTPDTQVYPPRRVRARVEGVVQGVGFRPYVFRLAGSLGLAGHVRNDSSGIVLEVEGGAEAVERFLLRLPIEIPPLAAIDRLSTEDLTPSGETAFAILRTDDSDPPSALVPADTATCDACLAELFDPADRRYRYPFINCTLCGPRFTIVRSVPYDRARTTMAGFEMCERCRAEYENPRDRRFHAQPNACPACGPTARLLDADGVPAGLADVADADDAVAAAAAALRTGAIVAVKGVGGYHLACRADDEAAVARLRTRKMRPANPFALMVADLDAARRLVRLGAVEARLLAGRERPILLARRRVDAAVADAVAPGQRDLGVMLPYAPLHHLLLADAGIPLVMTSGNRGGEPIAADDDDARERLGAVADLFLVHDRPIQTRADDSVARVVRVNGRRRPMLLRRSRGFVPLPLPLPLPAPVPLAACGAHLKNTVCVARGAHAWVGPHVGDLENFETLRSFEEGIEHLSGLFAVHPRVAAHDEHPDYLSTRYALEHGDLAPLAVQHHHAHFAACLAEHGEMGPAVGAILDGTGHGSDGTVWGGEILFGGLAGVERIGHLWPVRLPGGEAAVREPWRMACAWLAGLGDGAPALPPALAGRIDPARWDAVARLASSGTASPLTTSAGRLCDAVSALCGVCTHATYEGQAAMELEAVAGPRERRGYPVPLRTDGAMTVLDVRPLVRGVVDDLARSVPVSVVSARFHDGLADAVAGACTEAARRRGIGVAMLSGGGFQNVRLLERAARRLERAGLRVLVPARVPPNDGGISYGQAAVAAARAATD